MAVHCTIHGWTENVGYTAHGAYCAACRHPVKRKPMSAGLAWLVSIGMGLALMLIIEIGHAL